MNKLVTDRGNAYAMGCGGVLGSDYTALTSIAVQFVDDEWEYGLKKQKACSDNFVGADDLR